MITPIEQYTRSGLTVSIYPDIDAPNPVEEFDFPGDGAYESWREGDVFGYVVTNSRGEHIDSCWGFYGWDEIDYAKQCANEVADAYQDPMLHLLAF